MAWPSLVTSGQRILASDINSIITTFSTWADTVNSVLSVQGGAPVFGPGAIFGSVTFSVAPTFTDAAGTRTALGLPALTTIPTLAGANTFSVAGSNLQTIASTASGANVAAGVHLTNDAATFFSMRHYSSTATAALAGITLTNWAVLYSNASGGILVETANAAPIVFAISNVERARFNSDGTFTFSNAVTHSGTTTFSAAVTYSVGAAVTFSGSATFTGSVNLNGGNVFMARPTTYLNNGATWGLNITNYGAGDNCVLAQSGANYSVSGGLGWVGNGNVYLYFNSGQDFRIGSGVGATPIATFKGAGRLLLGTLTDNSTDLLQVAGSVSVNGITVATPANITLGSGWTTWSPTVTGWVSMTVSGLSVVDAQYLRIGPIVYFKFQASMTLGGTASSQVFVTLPISMAGAISCFTAYIKQAAGWLVAYGYADPSGNLLKFFPDGEANWALGTAWVWGEGFYRCA